MLGEAGKSNIDLVAKGELAGEPVGLLWNVGASRFDTDRAGTGPYTVAQLSSLYPHPFAVDICATCPSLDH